MYQGPDYEDPNPPEEPVPDPKAKGKPVKGAPPPSDEPLPPKMITPPPVVMEKESGRQFRVELGRMEKDPAPSQEPSQELLPDGKDSKIAGVSKEASNISLEQPSNENTHWVRFFAN